jgi:hypothetical protein
MPILAVPAVVPVDPIAAPAFPAPQATWTAPDGTQWELTSPSAGWKTLRDVAGIDAPAVELTTDPHPRGGARVRHVHPQPRIITWPLLVRGSTTAELTARWRALADAITSADHVNGPGTLTIDRPDGGGPRRIDCHYQDGFEDTLKLPGKHLAVLTLFCEDPYWQAVDPVTITRRHAEPVEEYEARDYLSPYKTVVSSQVLGATTLHNPGGVTAWPEWVITGPAAEITATLVSTGESWTVTPADIGGSLDVGDELRITTDPPQVRYHPAAGATENWVGALDWPTAVLWGLPPGTSEVTFVADDADADTTVTLSFHPRYRTS